MEELLPLIIGILWLVYTVYSKGQKKKSARESGPSGQSDKKPSFLEQLLSGEGIHVESPHPVDDDEEYAYELYEEPTPTVVPVSKGYSSPFLQTELSDFEEEGQAQFREAFAIDDEREESGYYSHSDLTQQMQDFDLKKAVVFSAILEAPYIDYK